MTATQLPLALVQRHYNRQLFSDYFLNTTLPAQSEWAALAAEAAPIMVQVAAIYTAYTPTSNEAQTEDGLIKPVLAALGHLFEVQATLRTPDGAKKPDYVFYRDAAAIQANKGRTLDDSLLASAIAVGDAKYWDRPLDVALKTGGDPFSNKNPAYQIAFYMQHSGVTWGILTNGRRWRLYHKETAHKLDRFYEVDLPELLAANDATTFLYLYAFFRRAAFESGPLGLTSLLEASSQYAQAVGDTLKMQVYEALRHLAQGLLDHPANALVADPATLKQMYDHALIVLYRLLFIFYAEARELLPIRASADYRNEYSLFAITRGVERRAKLGQQLLPTSARIWQQLKDLFQIINLGSPPLKVATFNGGLFDPERYPFLERYNVGDAHLQQAIDKLARVNGQFVDYRDLAERHLGTIYEGLLEHHLQPIAPEGGWTIDVFNDKGQRHRTGSYYTPDFIVRYMVDQTLGPLLQRAVAGQSTDAAKIAAVLSINLIDPAMGSGHFLVEATEYIARFLVDLGIAAAVVEATQAPADETDLAYWKRRVAQSCIYGVDLNPLAVDLAKLSLWLTTVAKNKPLSFLDHHLRAGNALVGARIAAVQVGGNPRKKAAKQVQPSAQISMLDDEGFRQSMSTAVGSMWLIEESAGDTVGAVKEQERIYAALREQMTRRYARLADLATASNFGLEIDGALWQPLADFATGRSLTAPAKFSAWLAAAEQIAATQRFFHYDLEFPEVFYDRHGQPLGERGGFDAVLGNPPYVRQEVLGPLKPYLQSAYGDVYHGVADLSVYFLAQGVNLLRHGGAVSYITSGTFRKLDFGKPLRTWLANNAVVDSLVSFGEQQLFTDATTYPVIITVRREQSTDNALTNVYEVSSASTFANTQPQRYNMPLDGKAWSFMAAELQHVLKGWNGSRPLREFLTAPIYRGITTGLNNAFVISGNTHEQLMANDPSIAQLIKPYVGGANLHVWNQEQTDNWILRLSNGWTRNQISSLADEQTAWNWLQNTIPVLAAHLAPFADDARKRYDQGEYWWELRPCNYYQIFEAPRIHSTKISLYPTFSLLEPVAYAANTSYVLPFGELTNGYYLLGLLNSHVSEYYSRKVFSPKANGYYEVQPEPLSQFPVPNAPAAERDAIGDLALKITAEAKARYELHRKAQRRIQNDLGTPDKALNQKLTAWWTLDFPTFRAEIQKVYKRDIPLRDRDDWDEWLHARRTEHATRTDAIVQMETDLNARVYALFDLTADEIKLIEGSTKYRYGEV